MHTESLAVIQKQWREKNSELEFVIDPSLLALNTALAVAGMDIPRQPGPVCGHQEDGLHRDGQHSSA